jgi:tetratricopeptide (TPR) repeat protein
MAPEQIRAFAGEGFSTIGPQTDVFGLAATIYELLTGKLPFGAASPADDGVHMLLEQRRNRPESIRATNPQVSSEFDELILECLSYEPEMRPQTAELLIARLTVVTQGVVRPLAATNRSSILKMTVAAAALLFAVSFLPLKGGQDAKNAALGLGDKGTIKEPELTPEVKLATFLADGYDAFEAKDFEKAEQLFLKAKQFDPAHEGAVIGWIRANFHLGNVEAAERAGLRIFTNGNPEMEALKGLCHAGIEKHASAIMRFRAAIDGGLATREVLTNLGYSLYRSGEYDEAVEVLEKVRRMGGDTTVANLLQVYAYSYIWQRGANRKKTGDNYDEQLLVSLIEECSDVPAKFKVASEIYVRFARSLKGIDSAAKEEWAQRSLAAFRQGLDVGLHPAYWNGIKNSMPQSILESEEAKQFTREAEGLRSRLHRTFYLLDPITGTRLDRCTERKLTVGPALKISTIIAAAK